MLDAVFGRYGSGLSVSFCVKLHFEKNSLLYNRWPEVYFINLKLSM